MHHSVIKLAQIPLHGTTQLLGVRCNFEIASCKSYVKGALPILTPVGCAYKILASGSITDLIQSQIVLCPTSNLQNTE